MTSSSDRFLKIAAHWWQDQPRITLEFSSQKLEFAKAFTALLVAIDGTRLTFRDVASEEEQTIDFGGTKIRFHNCERDSAVCAFAVRWESDSVSMLCVITELRDFKGKPS